MKQLSKFSGPNLISSEEYTHPNLWQREDYDGWSRLTIGSKEKEIPLILDMCKKNGGDFGILYVLLTSRIGNSEARYQSPYPINHEELSLFLYSYQEYLEQDGRHHLWVMSLSSDDKYIYDNHNIIHTYGKLDRHEEVLRVNGFSLGDVGIPAPHGHNYHPEFDYTEEKIMTHWDWIKFPLEPSDEA
jgi:hypothetical protein